MLQLLVYNKNDINHESDKNNIILRKSLFIILINCIKKSPKKIVSLTKCNDDPLRRKYGTFVIYIETSFKVLR